MVPLPRLLVMFAILLGGIVAVPAVQAWARAWGPRRAVCSFVEALRAGDSKGISQVVSPQLAGTLRRDTPWEPSERMIYRIDAVNVCGESALVTATLSECGVSVTPEFALERTADGRWLVVAIQGPE